MRYLKAVVLTALCVMAMGLAASSASATTLEENGVTTNSSVKVTASLKPGTVWNVKDTAGFSKNTCSGSHLDGATSSPFTGSSVTGNVMTWTVASCTRPVTVHSPGALEFTWTKETQGTVASEGTVATWGSPIGTISCQTGETTQLGTLTGVAAGTATIDLNAVVNCGIIPSAKWEGTFTITSPAGLGISA
jgi:hypothetical protein